MRCPFCAAEETRVVDSRLAGDGEQVRRRRECTVCRERFTTIESPALTLPRIVKQDGRRVPYSPEKLRSGMLKALEKRPVASAEVEEAARRIERALQAGGEQEVTSRQLGEWVMRELRAIDEVAYVRFASVYRSFQDVSEFRETVEQLEQEPHPQASEHQLPLLPGDR